MQDNRIIKGLLYAVSGCLIIFYLYVFYLGLNPQVSDQYIAYYIEHTISQWPN